MGVAVISSAFVLTRTQPLTDRAVASPSAALKSEILEKDSDGDGLLDWEESLWGTDPFLVDTDGDGILDGEFVASRKKDKSTSQIVADENLNFSEQFSRDFFLGHLVVLLPMAMAGTIAGCDILGPFSRFVQNIAPYDAGFRVPIIVLSSLSVIMMLIITFLLRNGFKTAACICIFSVVGIF